MTTASLRDVTEQDIPLIFEYTNRLAGIEGGTVTATEAALHAGYFGPDAVAKGVVAELDGFPVGVALYYFVFSNFLGQRVLYLEDIFVDEKAQGRGIGKQLMAELAHRSMQAGSSYMDWCAVANNQAAIDAYKSMGAQVQSGVVHFSFGENEMKALIGNSEGSD